MNAHMTPHDHLLHQLAQAEADGHRLPCRGPDWTDWTDDRPSAVQRAVTGCQTCSALTACRSYALNAEESGGVWGGTTPKERARTASARRAAGGRSTKNRTRIQRAA